jgi:hypothetical protein
MLWILIGVVLALSIYVAYKAMTPEGMNWKAGMAALAALIGAVYAWLAGLFHSAPPV